MMSKLKLTMILGMCLGMGADVLAQEQGRKATPAVVNPALRSDLRQTMSLDGQWDFAIDPQQQGEKNHWYRPDVPLPNVKSIQVPNTWEAQGVGGVGVSVSVTPEQQNRPLRGSYVGTAWYKKRVTIPAQWRGKEIWLKFGGVHAQGWFWANGTFLNHDDCYCGTYKYRVTDLVDAKGNLVIAAKVRNDVPSGKGLFGWLHRFGGLYRSVELDATPSVLVDYAFVEGNFDARSAAAHITLRSTQAQHAEAEVEVTFATLNGQRAGQASAKVTIQAGQTKDVVLKTPLRPFKAWSPEHPNLYRADIVLKRNGKAVDGWVERFGVRKWEVRGGNFYLNNRKHIVRGFGDDWVYPLTICSPPSREYHRGHLRLARAFGFNYVRHHTHCEIPEFYEAADEQGIMVQPELPYYGSRPSAAAKGWFRPKEDLRELVTHYRRYVSLSTYCTGNEGHLGSPLDKEICALAKNLDRTRLFLHQDGGHNTAENSDFGTGPAFVWRPGTVDGSRPFFAHEYLNLAVSRDPRLAWKYTGAQLPPLAAEPYLRGLEKSGLSVKWGDDMLDSGRYLQRLWQKVGLESARLDPVCDGYIYWTMMNVEFFADQGLLDQFWGVKKTTPRFFRQFNGPTTVLAAHKQAPIGADQRILAEGDKLRVDWWVSHFGEAPLVQAVLKWRVETDGRILGSGHIGGIGAEVGDVKQVGTMSFAIKDVDKPVKARLIGRIEGTPVMNSWDIWLFPRLLPQKGAGKGLAASETVYESLKSRYPGLLQQGKPNARQAEVLITDRMDGAVFDALSSGKSVLLVKLQGPKPGVRPGWWLVGHRGEQTGAAIADHPAFGDFPHQGYLNYLFFRLVKNTVKCREEEYRRVEKLMVNHGKDGYLAHVFQANAGKGRLLACGLDVLSDNVEAAYLLDQFIKYARSPSFAPRGEFDIQPAKRRSELTQNINGWSETVVQHQRNKYDSFLGPLTMDTARFSRGQTEVTWLTQPVPKNLKSGGQYSFKWAAALGWITQPAAEFKLMLGDKELLTFGVTQVETTWKSADGEVALKFLPMSKMAQGQDSSGIMELTLPAKMLKRGKKTLLRVVAPQTGSQRWFGLYHYR